MSAWTCRSSDGQAARKIVPPHLRIPCWKGPSADSEEKREPVGDIDTVAVESLKVLDPKRRLEKRTCDLRISLLYALKNVADGLRHAVARSFNRPGSESRVIGIP